MDLTLTLTLGIRFEAVFGRLSGNWELMYPIDIYIYIYIKDKGFKSTYVVHSPLYKLYIYIYISNFTEVQVSRVIIVSLLHNCFV